METEWFTYISTHLKFSPNVTDDSQDACAPIIVSYGVKGNQDQYENANHEQWEPEVRNPKRSNLKLRLPG